MLKSKTKNNIKFINVKNLINQNDKIKYELDNEGKLLNKFKRNKRRDVQSYLKNLEINKNI